MFFLCHHFNNLREYLEVFLFCGTQHMLSKKRDDFPPQILERSDAIPIQMLAVIVVTCVYENLAASEVLQIDFERWQAPFPLSYDKLRKYLPTELCGFVAKDAYREAPLTVGKTDDPLFNSWPFLLIGHLWNNCTIGLPSI